MKRLRIYGLLWFAALMLIQSAKAQTDAWKEAKAIFKNYRDASSLSFKADIKMYSTSNPGKIIDRLKAEYVVQRQHYYCKLGNVEIFYNEKGSFMIDHDEKVMIAGRRNRSHGKGGQEEAVYDLQTLFRTMRQDSIQLSLSASGTLKQLTVRSLSDPRIVQYKITYDTASYKVKQLQIEMLPEDDRYGKGNLEVDITYSGHNQTSKPDSYFSVDKYIYISGRQALMKPAYKSYQLVNQL